MYTYIYNTHKIHVQTISKYKHFPAIDPSASGSPHLVNIKVSGAAPDLGLGQNKTGETTGDFPLKIVVVE